MKYLIIYFPLCFAASLYGIGYEVLSNGDFESTFYGAGVPIEWKASAGDGNGNLQETINLSPFTNIYPAGSNSVRLADGTTNSILPSLHHGVLPSPTLFEFSFEFYLDAVNDAPWRIWIGSTLVSNLDFLIDAGNSFQYVGGTSGTVATLTPGAWYQLNATVDDSAQTVFGSLAAFGDTPTLFAGSLYPGGPARTDRVQIEDFSANQNATLYLDNFSVRTLPEPSALGILVSGCAVLLGLRRPFFRHQAP